MNMEEFAINQKTPLPALPEVDMSGKTIIITGANAGIGYQFVRYYLRNNAKLIIMACRSLKKAEDAKQTLLKDAGNSKADEVLRIEQIDMQSFESVQKCADRLNKTLKEAHIIHHNAGAALVPKSLTKDGYESILQTNALCTAQFALLMHPLLVKTAKASNSITRAVYSCTDGVYFPPPDVLDHQSGLIAYVGKEREFDAEGQIWHYTATKWLTANFFTEYAKLVKNDPITVWLAAPGLTQTEFGQKSGDGELAKEQKNNEEMYGVPPRTPWEGAKSVMLAAIDEPAKYGGTPGEPIRLSNMRTQPLPETITGDTARRGRIYKEIQAALGQYANGIDTNLVAAA